MSSHRLYSDNLWNSDRGEFEPGVIEISGNKIVQLKFGKPEGTKAKQKILDFGALFIGPSAIDLHVHARDFKESHKETLETCAQAAAKGGVSVAVCMANTQPRLDNVNALKEFFKKADQQDIRFIPFAAVTKNLEGREPTEWNQVLRMPIAGLSDDGKPLLDEEIFKAALMACRKKAKFISLHEEDSRISHGSQMHKSETSMKLGMEGSHSDAESWMVERDLKIGQAVKAHIHLGHISSAQSIHLIRKAKQSGQSVSAELTPHHAHLSVEHALQIPYERMSDFKVCPPIRSKEDREALRKASLDGVIDCFASDHAPHSHFEKNVPYDKAMHGLISLEYFFTLYNELRLQTKMKWSTFFKAARSRPASLLPHLKDLGVWGKGGEASFILFDPLLQQKLKFEKSRSNNSLFDGQSLRGVVFQHWVRGKKVYDIIESR